MTLTIPRALLGALLAVFAIFASAPLHAQAVRPLDVETGNGVQRLQVEVMRTDPEIRRGLMFRREMAADHGMLFEFVGGEPILMWMKNTYIPLDMIFFRDKRVVAIVRNTEPLSEKLITSGEPASAVIEVNAGTADRLGIAVGDRLIFPVERP